MKQNHFTASLVAFLLTGGTVLGDIANDPRSAAAVEGASWMLVLAGGLLASAVVAIAIIRVRNARQRKPDVR
ncbi:MAG: hypothetical protein JNM43_17310 [Planctomycetaceae bacterium]|nr:hypothetical protein [Planctomycetaceae bacterium]